MQEWFRFQMKKKKKRLRELSSIPEKTDRRVYIRDAKDIYKRLRGIQDGLREMFPGLIKKDTKEVMKNELRSDKGSTEEHRYDYY